MFFEWGYFQNICQNSFLFIGVNFLEILRCRKFFFLVKIWWKVEMDMIKVLKYDL